MAVHSDEAGRFSCTRWIALPQIHGKAEAFPPATQSIRGPQTPAPPTALSALAWLTHTNIKSRKALARRHTNLSIETKHLSEILFLHRMSGKGTALAVPECSAENAATCDVNGWLSF